MERINIDTIKKFVTCGKIRWTNHVIIRLLQRNINQRDVEHALLNGTIIEEYENDYPYPSCLILGYNIDNKILHIVCGISEDTVHIITAYYPNTDKWEEDMKTRREK